METTRHFLLEWLSYTCRYIPVGLLDVIPQRLNWRPPAYSGRDDLETLMASDSAADWVCYCFLFQYGSYYYQYLGGKQYSCIKFLLFCRFEYLRCCLARCLMVSHLHRSTNPMHMTEQKMAKFFVLFILCSWMNFDCGFGRIKMLLRSISYFSSSQFCMLDPGDDTLIGQF